MLKKIYLSPLGFIISLILNFISIIHKPFMVYGFYNSVTKKFHKYTRLSSSIKIINKKKLNLENNIWIGHYCILDASNGIKICEGVQTGSFISIYSHSSHNSIRLLGESYLKHNDRIGYVKGKVEIGKYSFIGTSSVVFPNVKIGKGCLIKSFSVVTKSISDYSIVEGNPAKVIGSVLEFDKKYFDNELVQETYFDKEIIEKWKSGTL